MTSQIISNVMPKIDQLGCHINRNQPVYVTSQCETMLHCNVVSHWLGADKMMPAFIWILSSRGWINIKMSSYQYRKSHCGDKMILWQSYLHNGISYNDMMTSLYWIRVLIVFSINHYLAHYSLVMPYGDIDKDKRWIRQWLGAISQYWLITKGIL